jgi:predicted ester cyclase
VVVVVQALPRAFPDLHHTIEEIALGDGVVTVPTTVRDAHRDDYFGLPGTGRAFRVSRIAVERFPRRPNHRPPRVSDGQSLARRSGVIG